MTTMRYRYLLVSVFLVIPAAAVAQSRADTVAVARVTVSEFGQRHPVFLDARRGFVGHLHDAGSRRADAWLASVARDRKSTRLNSSHVRISYAVFCLKKKKIKKYRYVSRC